MRQHLAEKVKKVVSKLVEDGLLPESGLPEVEISDTKQPEHGDFACNFALAAAKAAGANPRELGTKIAGLLSQDDELEKVDVAGPGFINITIKPSVVGIAAGEVLDLGVDRLARSKPATPLKLNVEFVSVNPNGPITVGSGRGAAFGSTLCNVLASAGNDIWREYYINDGVNSEQMRMFAESVRCLALGMPLPEKAYRGDYVQDVADKLVARGLMTPGEDHPVYWFQKVSQDLMLERQRDDLANFGVEFDVWFSEQSLHDSGEVERCLDELLANGVADTEPVQYAWIAEGSKGRPKDDLEEDEGETEMTAAPDQVIAKANPPQYGKAVKYELKQIPQNNTNTLWLRSTRFGDDMDRVLRRKDGRLTYIASDLAYHHSKFSRPVGCEKLLTVLGPDHHGYVGRLKSVVKALGHDGDQIEVPIFQIVRFVKEGKPAPMRKRDGNIYALIDLIDELGKTMAPSADQQEQRRIGRDVARFFYLMRSHDTHMDFDIDLATKQSDENPVFYVQYAHARICSVIDKAKEAGFEVSADANLSLLVHAREKALILKVLDLPNEVMRCADDYGVHRLTTYAVELARVYHHFYDACRVIQSAEPELTKARLALCQVARIGLQATFALLGISAPERMERDLGEEA